MLRVDLLYVSVVIVVAVVIVKVVVNVVGVVFTVVVIVFTVVVSLSFTHRSKNELRIYAKQWSRGVHHQCLQ